MNCEYCKSEFTPDSRKNCSCCGAPHEVASRIRLETELINQSQIFARVQELRTDAWNELTGHIISDPLNILNWRT